MSTRPDQQQVRLLALLFVFAEPLRICSGDVGTAAQYIPPYLPTACYGNGVSEFPSSNLFAAAGEVIWDNGTACGRQYLVRCLSAPTPGTCKTGQTIRVRIVDRAQTAVSRPPRNGAVLLLSTTAFGVIANSSTDWVSVEFAPA